jgi:transposase-like protein
MNIREITQLFKTDDDCLAYVQQMRWPDGIVRCPACGAKEPVKVERTAKSKNKRGWFYLCAEKSCRTQFSPTAGTIFHGTHIPLIVWFHAIAIILNAKKGISALQLQRDLGIGGYKTAWYLNHRIREAMAEGAIPTMGGIVEIDETYVGGKQKGKGVWYGKQQKQTVVGLRQRKGPLRFVHTPDAKATTLKAVIEANVSPDDVYQFMSDTASATHIALKQLGQSRKHRTVNHIRGQYVDGHIHTNTIESAFSLLKRGIIGSYHRISIKHLQRYLNEFSYRFNRREDANAFIETVRRLCGFPPLTFTALTSEKA